ncbi:hypothetical protein HanRHA438_Chr04g0189061 [Helianthus annuus]|nr:hypothetical protein HanIR_Chr04g0193111 [Helianthus annuus]KAJ0762211.1 hypothetical protein HanOQP8_Chr04g0158871 [Helianthus annuus]KAJ0927984.1 hypothetical protein HanRHA438_Chr04g0189061 [Helianthus annuus]
MGLCYFKEILINQSIMKTPRMLPKLLMLVVVFVTSLLIRTRDPQASLAKAGCQEMCGNIISIPYPFGIGAGCYMLESFEASCIRSSHDHVPLWFANDHEFPILEFPQILVHVAHESTKSRCAEFEFTYGLDTPGQYFSLSHERNLYVAVGCNITAYFLVYPLSGAVCKSLCNEASPVIGSPTSCTGFNGCCHLSIPKNVTSYNIMIRHNTNSSLCSHAFVSENSAPIYFDERQLKFPLALNWVVGHTTCHQARKTGDNLCGRNNYCVDSTNGLEIIVVAEKVTKGSPTFPMDAKVISCYQLYHFINIFL